MSYGTAWYVMECPVERVLPLRAEVSYAGEGRSVEECRFYLDTSAGTTVHWVAIVVHPDGSEEDIGCLSMYDDPRKVAGVFAPLRLRALAVKEKYRGLGVGRGLMASGIAKAEQKGDMWAWGSARSERLSLYESLGALIDPKVYRVDGRPYTYQDVVVGPL